MKVKRLKTKSLTNDKHLGAMNQNWDIINDFEPAGQTLLATVKANFNNCMENEDAAYKRSVKDFNSEDMHKADELRGDYVSAVRTITQGYSQLPDESPLKRVGKEMYQIFKDYNFSTSDSYTGESVKLDNMWQVFSQNQAKLETLGVWQMLQTAMTYNEQVKAYFNARIDVLSTRVVGELREARAASDTAYQQLCDVLDAMLLLAPSEALSNVVRHMNALTDYYNQYYLKGSSPSSEGGGTTPSQGGESGGEQGGGGTTPDPGTGGCETPDPGTGGGTTPDNPDPGTGGGGGADPDDPTNSED